MTLHIRILTSLDEITGCRAAWNALAETLGGTAIFHDAEVTMLNLKVGMDKRRASPHVLTVFESEAMIAAAPMVWAPNWIGLGVLYWADSGTSLYSGLLCKPDREGEVFALMAQNLWTRRGLRKLKADYVPATARWRGSVPFSARKRTIRCPRPISTFRKARSWTACPPNDAEPCGTTGIGWKRWDRLPSSNTEPPKSWLS